MEGSAQTFVPPEHGTTYMSQAVVDRPKEGVHFNMGELLKEVRT